MNQSISHKIFFPNPPQMVWDYLTIDKMIEQWLMPNNFLPILGYDFEFRTNPLPQLDFDGIIYCKIVEILPYKKLSYSWKSGPGNGDIAIDSIVVWTLIEKDGGTELCIDHSGFKEMEHFNMFSALNNGWLKNMQKVYSLINDQKQ